MENFTSLIKEKGQIFKTRKSVNSPYRLGLRFKNINDRDKYLIAQLSDVMGYKIQVKETRARIISNKFVEKLFNSSEVIEGVMAESMMEDPMVCKVFNEYTTKDELKDVKVSEDLPF